MAYDPYQFAAARANVIGGMASGIEKAVVDTASQISQIAKQKGIEDKINGLYKNTVDNFIKELMEADPETYKDETKARITAMRRLPAPMEGMSNEDKLKTMLSSSMAADKFLEDVKTKSSASQFTKKAGQPVTETRQIQAEGPPIQQGERMGEVPMEQQISQRPMRTEEYQRGFEQLTPEAQKMVPESVGKRVTETEEIYKRPLKTFEEEREKSLKQRQEAIKTASGVDKGAGFNTAIIESQNSAESLKSKQKTVNELIKLTTKMNNLPLKQIESGKQTDMMMEAERIAEELGIPQQRATDPEFLGRMNAEIDQLVKKEEQQQKDWEDAKKEWEKKEQQELEIKRIAANRAGREGVRGGYLALAASKLSEAEKTQVASIAEGQSILSNLVTTYKTSGYGGAGSLAGEAAAKTPLVGKFIAPKHAEYQKQKELASEIWLRAATGAATNPSEIKRYAGFLPDESDPPNLAQSKMDNFFTKVMAKVEGRGQALEMEAKALENQGEIELANAKRTHVSSIKNMILQSKASIPSLFEGKQSPKTTVPATTSSDDDIISRYLK